MTDHGLPDEAFFPPESFGTLGLPASGQKKVQEAEDTFRAAVIGVLDQLSAARITQDAAVDRIVEAAQSFVGQAGNELYRKGRRDERRSAGS